MLRLLGDIHVETSLVAALWIAAVPARSSQAVTVEGQYLERLEIDTHPSKKYEVIVLLNTHVPTERVAARFDSLFEAVEATKNYCNELNLTWNYGGSNE